MASVWIAKSLSSNPTVPKLQEERVRGGRESSAGVGSIDVRPPLQALGFVLRHSARRDAGLWAFPGSVLDEDSWVHQAAKKKAPATNK